MLGQLFLFLFFLLFLFSCIHSEIYFEENFDDDQWTKRWTVSSWRSSSELGEWNHTPGDWFVDENDKGIKTSNDAKFYAISAPFQKEFNNLNKDLIIQFTIKHEQGLDCGGGYLKIMSKDIDPLQFGGETPYSIMFGPDKCGMNHQTHAILNYARPKGEKESKNMDHQSNIEIRDDKNTHLYTFRIYHNDTYDIKIDSEIIQQGKLAENWPFQPEKEIPDPKASKPNDWIDEEQIPDPSDRKPEHYDDIPAQIPDPEAEKPEDWDDEDDGEWEPPLIDNPEYQGEWKPKMIPNPDYKGPWIHPKIPNPDYFESNTLHARCTNCYRVGIDIWQVKSGSLFDDMLITDEINEANAHEQKVMEKIKKLKEKHDEIEKEEAKKLEEARKKAEEEAKHSNSEEDDESSESEEPEEESETDDVKEEL